MGAAIAEANKENFRDLVSEGIVMVDLWGTSCQVCMALMPAVEQMAEDRTDIKVVKLEAPKARRLCMELKVLGLPAFLLFNDGIEVSRLAGPDLSADQVRSWVEENLQALQA